MEEQPSFPNVSIPCHNEQRDKKKRYTVYKVMVSVGRHEWFVFRRYAEFDKLYNTLRKQFPSMNLKIPAKRIFGDNFDPEFIKQRRAGLHEFIKRIVSNPQLSSHPDVRSFLLMDRKHQLSDASEDEDDKVSKDSWEQLYEMFASKTSWAKPTDFDFLKVIGKGSFGKVFLAKRRHDGKYYAVKVLQKKIILNRKEDEIKTHSFFLSINWKDLEEKKIPPPFTPNVSCSSDITNFDPEFTEEMVPNSICWTKEHSIVNASVMEADDAFLGFSYAPPSDDSFQ
ncbi:hypothetical protein CCH79_00004177 [Gambusia affinis]|uniref:PX domain-containing protein n=1 Tax=Gambusia affinis TaxID=33528 RepID=A0A315V550_GAMAF|nr:hypothetical protein CCH79_00004177 [Gambusia affinis]